MVTPVDPLPSWRETPSQLAFADMAADGSAIFGDYSQ
jgi:hypothetical protein